MPEPSRELRREDALRAYRAWKRAGRSGLMLMLVAAVVWSVVIAMALAAFVF